MDERTEPSAEQSQEREAREVPVAEVVPAATKASRTPPRARAKAAAVPGLSPKRASRKALAAQAPAPSLESRVLNVMAVLAGKGGLGVVPLGDLEKVLRDFDADLVRDAVAALVQAGRLDEVPGGFRLPAPEPAPVTDRTDEHNARVARLAAELRVVAAVATDDEATVGEIAHQLRDGGLGDGEPSAELLGTVKRIVAELCVRRVLKLSRKSADHKTSWYELVGDDEARVLAAAIRSGGATPSWLSEEAVVDPERCESLCLSLVERKLLVNEGGASVDGERCYVPTRGASKAAGVTRHLKSEPAEDLTDHLGLTAAQSAHALEVLAIELIETAEDGELTADALADDLTVSKQAALDVLGSLMRTEAVTERLAASGGVPVYRVNGTSRERLLRVLRSVKLPMGVSNLAERAVVDDDEAEQLEAMALEKVLVRVKGLGEPMFALAPEMKRARAKRGAAILAPAPETPTAATSWLDGLALEGNERECGLFVWTHPKRPVWTIDVPRKLRKHLDPLQCRGVLAFCNGAGWTVVGADLAAPGEATATSSPTTCNEAPTSKRNPDVFDEAVKTLDVPFVPNAELIRASVAKANEGRGAEGCQEATGAGGEEPCQARIVARRTGIEAGQRWLDAMRAHGEVTEGGLAYYLGGGATFTPSGDAVDGGPPLELSSDDVDAVVEALKARPKNGWRDGVGFSAVAGEQAPVAEAPVAARKPRASRKAKITSALNAAEAPATRDELAAETGLPVEGVSKALGRLVDKGRAHHVRAETPPPKKRRGSEGETRFAKGPVPEAVTLEGLAAWFRSPEQKGKHHRMSAAAADKIVPLLTGEQRSFAWLAAHSGELVAVLVAQGNKLNTARTYASDMGKVARLLTGMARPGAAQVATAAGGKRKGAVR